MTALKKYQRLESPGLWRETPDAQRRDVVVAFREATLVLFDPKTEKPLSHWSLPAILRANPGELPAIFVPAPEDDESLEIDDTMMIEPPPLARIAARTVFCRCMGATSNSSSSRHHLWSGRW